MAKLTTSHFLKPLHTLSLRLTSSLSQPSNHHANHNNPLPKPTLATELASLVQPHSPAKTQYPIPQTRTQLKRFLQLRIKKRVKSNLSHNDGKFHNLILNVVSNPQTLQDAYNIIKLNSNIIPNNHPVTASAKSGENNGSGCFLNDVAHQLNENSNILTIHPVTVSAKPGADKGDGCFLYDVAKQLQEGSFDASANTYKISTRKNQNQKKKKSEDEDLLALILPNLKLRVVQEALRIVLEVIFKPNFSRISHGCRSGKGRAAALKYVCKGVVSPDWWFTLLVSKKFDGLLMEKLVCVMEDKIEDGCLFDLIRSMFDARVLNFEFGGFAKGDGLPQEGVLSPILMNIYLDIFDSEFHRLAMKYEGVRGGGEVVDGDKTFSALRGWFRSQLNGNGSDNGSNVGVVESSGVKVYCVRFMDEIFFAVSGSKDCAVSFKSEIESYLKESLMLDVGDGTDVLPCIGSRGVRFLGTLVKRNVEESNAVKAVHKMKDKVELFALQKLEAWNYGTARIGKKWLGHGLKKVKESEIKHLADSSSLLSKVSHFRKPGMETDHWYKHLMKIWMQDVQVKNAKSEENVLSMFVGEPALPQELTDSFYEFMKQAEKYVSAEADSILKLLPNNNSSDSVSQHQNRSSIHDCIFFFRICRNFKPPTGNATAGGSLEARNISSQYLYGYVFNRQRHDERLKRGGEQKSVVILSHRPYSNVFRPLLQIVGPLFFDIGKKALEHIAAYVSKWPPPVPGQVMDLPIGNASLKVNLPPALCLPVESGLSLEDSASSNQSALQGLFHDSDLFGSFRGLLLQLWLLWELFLIGEPMLIIAPTPPQCCEAVASLVSLVAPLLCSVDFRPYFTIHDPVFAQLNSIQEGEAFPPVILGVTNLFFLKALRNIPHIVSVGSPPPNSNRVSLSSRSSSTGRISGRPEGLGFQQLSLKKFSPSSLLNAVKMRRDGPLCLMTEHKEAIWSTYSATTKPDTSILNRLIDAGLSPRVEESMSVVNNEILRRHFLELTTNFLAPFSPYFRTTIPSEGSSPYTDPPSLPQFDANEFLASLSARGPGKFILKRMKSNWLDLYRRFLNGPNFMPWFRRRRAVAEQEQDRLWRQARIKTDIQQLISKFSEVEIVDSFNVIERLLLKEIQMQQSGKGRDDSMVTSQKLRGDLQAVFNVLSKDMQQLMLSNPQRASLLHGSPEVTNIPGHPLQVAVVSSTSPG